MGSATLNDRTVSVLLFPTESVARTRNVYAPG